MISVCGATRVLAHQQAKRIVKESIRSHALKLQAYTARELNEWAAVYVNDHYWELMAWATTVVDEWCKEKVMLRSANGAEAIPGPLLRSSYQQ